MKALGVGIIKRKMANAAVPVVVVEIQDDGESGLSLNFLESHSHPIAKYQLDSSTAFCFRRSFGPGLKPDVGKKPHNVTKSVSASTIKVHASRLHNL